MLDWEKVRSVAAHIQIDVTDGIFAGDGTFRDIARLKQLPESQKIELHMMVQRPADYMEAVIDLLPARCIFHIESFAGGEDLESQYEMLRNRTSGTELGVAINPDSPSQYLEEYLHVTDYVLFMGYNPGFAGQVVNPIVFSKIGQFRGKHPDIPIAVDGHVGFDTVEDYAKAGARILYSNSAIFKSGDPRENIQQLKLKAQSAVLK